MSGEARNEGRRELTSPDVEGRKIIIASSGVPLIPASRDGFRVKYASKFLLTGDV
jgi:hypothetical protein